VANEHVKVTLYPNPVNDWLTLEAPMTINSIHVFDLSGKMVLDHATNDNIVQLDVSKLETGVYLIYSRIKESEYSIQRVSIH
jgi:hypothetical protein